MSPALSQSLLSVTVPIPSFYSDFTEAASTHEPGTHDTFSGAWSELREADSPEFEDEDGEKQTGWKLLETYLNGSPIPGDERPEAVEVAVEANLSAHGLPKLVGVLDLARPGGRIVDFKTSGKTPDPE